MLNRNLEQFKSRICACAARKIIRGAVLYDIGGALTARALFAARDAHPAEPSCRHGRPVAIARNELARA